MQFPCLLQRPIKQPAGTSVSLLSLYILSRFPSQAHTTWAATHSNDTVTTCGCQATSHITGRKNQEPQSNSSWGFFQFVPKTLVALSDAIARRRADAQVDADEYTCEAEIMIPLDTPTLLMQEIAERVAVATMIRDTPGDTSCPLL